MNKKNSIRPVAEVLAGIDSPGHVQEFLDAILTPSERGRIALRWKLVCMLESGLSQRTIARRLGISLCKITRGSRELKYGPRAFREVVAKAVRSKRKERKKK